MGGLYGCAGGVGSDQAVRIDIDPVMFHNFKTVCYSNAVRRRAAMRLSQHFVKNHPNAAHAHGVYAMEDEDARRGKCHPYTGGFGTSC